MKIAYILIYLSLGVMYMDIVSHYIVLTQPIIPIQYVVGVAGWPILAAMDGIAHLFGYNSMYTR